ncbi:MAG: O-acetylhomoserine aminocarboxypropyltransferase/cysteine synthase [Actinobacteria bacterium]|nr:O-acetylhomoserine aminocarboxypropyltransferase/cysteine synthase [Actinomycetota bacterium]
MLAENISGFTTKAIHSDVLKKDVHGALHMPVYDTVAFEFDKAEEMEQTFLGKKPGHVYTRISNPTVENLEQKVKNITKSFGVVAFASGMAAISNLILTIAGNSYNIITTKHLFGNTYSLFERTLKPWGLEIKYTDLTDPEKVSNLIDKKTVAVFFETITNPQLEVVDIKALSKICKEKGILLIADTTVTPPYLFKSRDFGVDIEVLSSTKYISGGATSVGGLIIDNGTFDWIQNNKLSGEAEKLGPFTLIMKLKREVYRNLGACMAPHNAYLQSLGLETLALRADKSCASTLVIAGYLEKNKKIERVNYPGLKSSEYYELAKKQFDGKAGALFTFDLNSKKSCFKFMNNLIIIRRATNLHDNKTLILHPSSTIFCEYSEGIKSEMGIRDTMIRVAVGIEDVEDLLNDFADGLKNI